MWTLETIFELVTNAVAETACVDVSTVHNEDWLIGTLQLDSLDITALTITIQSRIEEVDVYWNGKLNILEAFSGRTDITVGELTAYITDELPVPSSQRSDYDEEEDASTSR